MAAANLAIPIYNALIANSAVAAAVAAYGGGPAVFTSRPVPDDALYPMIISAGDVTRSDNDMVVAEMPIIVRDISIFGRNTVDPNASAPNQNRTIETLALQVRDLFHRKRQSLSVPGWSVIDIVCKGPFTGPVDDDMTVHRLLTLTIRLSPA